MFDKKEYMKAYYQANKEKVKEQTKAYYEANKEKRNAQKREYYKKNKEELKASGKDWREANKEKIKAYKKAWYKVNKEKKKAHDKAYKQANKGKVNALTAKRKASKLQRTPSWLTKEDLAEIEDIYRMAKRRSEVEGIEYHVDHIIPLQGRNISGLHVPSNLQILRATENLRKSNKHG